jgi:hypothetical protein
VGRLGLKQHQQPIERLHQSQTWEVGAIVAPPEGRHVSCCSRLAAAAGGYVEAAVQMPGNDVTSGFWVRLP